MSVTSCGQSAARLAAGVLTSVRSRSFNASDAIDFAPGESDAYEAAKVCNESGAVPLPDVAAAMNAFRSAREARADASDVRYAAIASRSAAGASFNIQRSRSAL